MMSTKKAIDRCKYSWVDSNHRRRAYKARALPLSYRSIKLVPMAGVEPA